MFKAIVFYLTSSRSQRDAVAQQAFDEAVYVSERHGRRASRILKAKSKQASSLQRIMMYRMAAKIAIDLPPSSAQSSNQTDDHL